MPELAVRAVTITPAAAPSDQSISVDAWYRGAVIPPPPDDFEIAEVRAIPTLVGEHSRITITTRAGITMTVVVTDVEGTDGRPQWGNVQYHLYTNNVNPQLRVTQIVSVSAAADSHNAVLNAMVQRVQAMVLRQRHDAEEAQRRQRVQAAMQETLADNFVVPPVIVGNTTNLRVNNDTTGIYTWNMTLQWTTNPTTITTWPDNNSFVYNNTWQARYQPPPLTPEQQAERKAKAEAERKAVEEANKRAEQLLLDLLGEMGFARYKRKGYVLVMSRTKPGTVYRVRGMAGIDLYERNKLGKIIPLKKYLCIHPQETYPEADIIAAQVLLCRYDEENLWETANIHNRGESNVVYDPRYANYAA